MILATYNILNPYHAVKWDTCEGLTDDGADNWELSRRDKIINNLNLIDFDVCCLQEISDRTYPELSKYFTFSGFAKHWTKDQGGAHGTAVIYRPERIQVIRSMHYQTPGPHWRCASTCDIKEYKTGKVIRVVSVHLKGYNPYEEELSVKREQQQTGDQELDFYLNEIEQDLSGIDGIVIMGDFNEDHPEMIARGDHSRQGVLIKRGFTWDRMEDVTESRTGRKIDWIFYKDVNSSASSLEHCEVNQDRSASDHAITASIIKW